MNRNFYSLMLLDGKQNDTSKPATRQHRKRIRNARVKQQTGEPGNTEVRPSINQDEEEYLPKRKITHSTQEQSCDVDYYPENKYPKRQYTFNDGSAPKDQEVFNGRSNPPAGASKNGRMINIKPLCYAIRELSIALNSTASLHTITKLNKLMLSEFNDLPLDGHHRKEKLTKNIELLSNTVNNLIYNQWTGQSPQSIKVVENTTEIDSGKNSVESPSRYESKSLSLYDSYDDQQKMTDSSGKKDSIESSIHDFSSKYKSKPQMLDSYDESPTNTPIIGQRYDVNDDTVNLWSYYTSLLGENQPQKADSGKKDFSETLGEDKWMKRDKEADNESAEIRVTSNQVNDVPIINLWDHYSSMLGKNHSQKAGTQEFKTQPTLRDNRQTKRDRTADRMPTNVATNHVNGAPVVNLWDHYSSMLGKNKPQTAGTQELKETQPTVGENRETKRERTQNHHNNIPPKIKRLYQNESLSDVSEEVMRGREISWVRRNDTKSSNDNEQKDLAHEVDKFLRSNTDRDVNREQGKKFSGETSSCCSQGSELPRQESGSNGGRTAASVNSNDAADLNYYPQKNFRNEQEYHANQHALSVLWSLSKVNNQSNRNAAKPKPVRRPVNKNVAKSAHSVATASLTVTNSSESNADSAFSIQPKKTKKRNYQPDQNGPKTRSHKQKITNHDNTIYSGQMFFGNNNNNHDDNSDNDESNRPAPMFNPRLFLTRNMDEYYDES